MKPFLSACAALAVLGAAALPLPAQVPGTALPGPAGRRLKMIDQGQAEPRLKGYSAPEGVKVEIVADFPTVVNPVGMAFADDGSLFVLEWLPDDRPTAEVVETRYKDGTTRRVPMLKKKVKDRVKVLRDTKGNGTFDQAEVVLEDELPSGILLDGGWMYIAGRGTVRRYRQSKPGGPYDVREVIAQGFSADYTHQVSGLALGNDGWLYVTAWDGDNIVEGSDGSRATVLGSGAVFRCRPDGARMEVYAVGLGKPRGAVAFDKAFNPFLIDQGADLGKFTGSRLLYVAEGTDYNRLPPVLVTGRGTAAGLLCYKDTRFPEAYRGLLYYPDAANNRVRAYRVEPFGATFAATEEFDFLKADDELFHPCQALTGPDGAMYVCDTRTDPGTAERLGGDGRHGRILRIRWAGTDAEPAIPLRGMDSWAKIDRMSEDDLLKALAAPDFSDRQRAQRALVRQGEKVRPALLKLLDDTGQPVPARIAALGALGSMWNDEVEDAVLRRLDDEADLRRLAADALGLHCARGDRKAHEALLQVLGDGNLAVRRAVALAMGRIAGPGAPDALANALAFDDGKDQYLREGLVRAIEYLGKPGIDRLRALAESGAEENIDRAVAAFLLLRTRPGAEAVPELLKNPHLTVAQRAALVRSYRHYRLDPPVDVEPLMAYLLANRDEAVQVKQAGLEVLAEGSVRGGEKARAWLRAMREDNNADLAREAARLLRAGEKAGRK